jgi:dipeptidase D
MISFTEKEYAGGVFDYFLEFSKIPHCSHNTAPIAEYLTDFAKKHGLVYIRDNADNVIIKKPATAGYESRPTVIIQGHTDMVADKLPELDKDMLKEGIEVYRDGDWLRARGTTLGGDDGVAMAYALALLASNDIPHPAIEALFTSNEEVGLLGASALDCSVLDGRIMINIDSDEEGIFTVGCAGGGRVDTKLPVTMTKAEGKAYCLHVSGLLGGHSGVEIGNNRTNAVKVGTDILASLGSIRIYGMHGGSMDNAIPREFIAHFTAENDISELFAAAREKEITAAIAYEPDIAVTLTEDEAPSLTLDEKSSKTVLSLFSATHTGVISMSADIEGLVESSQNIGIVRLDDNYLSLTVSVRSSKRDAKRAIIDKLFATAKAHGAEVSLRGEYPAWEFKPESHLRDVAVRVWRDMYGKDAEVIAIHAGLECGIFSDAMPGLDCISIGPDNRDIHTTEEHLSISSTVRVWEFLLEVLKQI